MAKKTKLVTSTIPSPGQHTLTIDQQVLTIDQALDFATQLCNMGHLPKAESICNQILHKEPSQPAAFQLLGVFALEKDKADTGIGLIKKALAIKPDFADAHYNLSLAHEKTKLQFALAKALDDTGLYAEASSYFR